MARAIPRLQSRLEFREEGEIIRMNKAMVVPLVVKTSRQTEDLEMNWVKVESCQTFKTVFLGDSNVGKTCLAHMFANQRVLEHSSNTIGFDHYVRKIDVDEGIQVKLQIWDTAGMEQFRNALITRYYRNADGIILVYDITRKQTFQNIDLWIKEVRTYVGPGMVKMTLIGNKLDQAAEREVLPEEGQALADRHGMMFYEISATDIKQLSKLEEIFAILGYDMFKTREKSDFTRSQSGVIRLENNGDPSLSEDWIFVNEPEGPIPRSTYAAQEMKARLQHMFPWRSHSRHSNNSMYSRSSRNNNKRSGCCT